VDWLADEVNLSTRQLQRKLRAITDLSAGGYIRMMRLERASQLIAQDWGNVSEIAYKVGFQDAKYFSKLFKQTFGSTPTEYAEEKA
ncbi:MAG TPA: helix-turn-helix transcriptional regulator, partial [Halalkalibaculum sp.]|nr:helix-turn-helix transcriptional regulator [Halalkalibaculum sp.]